MAASDRSQLLRRIPQVERALSSPLFQSLVDSHSRAVVTRELRGDLQDLRQRATQGGVEERDLELESIRDRVEDRLRRSAVPYYQRVINATGIVLHTGLGRAPLSEDAVHILQERAGHTVRLEIDLETGERGGRDEGCAKLIRELAGAEAATVVNNNAGATLLILAALARGKEIILSRGEMVEIGGSYRIPEIMAESGGQLVGVGTTNRTHLRDYARAITENTGMILKVHTSNYLVCGFTAEVPIDKLVTLGREHSIPVVHDLGSGCLIDLAARGVPGEPGVQVSIDAGADLVCFSGDKLLGGPQAGLIAGRGEAVARCKEHPLMRALRPDRLTYMALEATLRLYQRGDRDAIQGIPALRRLLAEPSVLEGRAKKLAKKLAKNSGLTAEVIPHTSQAGSGSLPTRELPTFAVVVEADAVATTDLAHRLRTGDPPILPRIQDDRVLLDVRTIDDDEVPAITRRFQELLGAD